MHSFWLGLRLLGILAAANMAPIAAKRLLGTRWDAPLDGGRLFPDGRPVLGPSKTWRGLVASVAASAAGAFVVGLPAATGALAGAVSMLGDALSSFAKRRLGIASSGRATGLDQVPEALLPLLAMQPLLGLTWPVIAGVTIAFFVLEVPVARWSYRLGLRDAPY